MHALPRRLAALALAAAACGARHVTLPAEPDVTLAAHRDPDGFVIDRLPDGATGLLVRPGRFHSGEAPDLTLRVRDEPRGGLWVIGHSRVLVREGPSTSAPRIGEVMSTWDGRAIRLTLYGRDASPLRTDVFTRADDGPGAPSLARDEPGTAPRGTYRAAVRDAGEAAVGWMRVQIPSTDGAPRVYDAVFPRTVDGALAAGAAVALDAEIDWLVDSQRKRSVASVVPTASAVPAITTKTLETASTPRRSRPCEPSEMR